ncbi:MAG: hypothetical protein DME98_05710 [Verrucomicrobia bacterium]|nr:MAG: hypothetical protein DME98_05710 [Verrucomicrobiota bacterium]
MAKEPFKQDIPACPCRAISCIENALTAILGVVYTRRYDYEIFYSNLYNRICWRLYCASAVADSGRMTCSIANGCKTSHA